MKTDIGVVGLAVMGENLILNIESRGFAVACTNRTTSKVDDFVAGRAAGRRILGAKSLKELVASLERPRKVLLMVKAGGAVDALIDELAPLLEPGDIVIDGGNSYHVDTARRMAALAELDLLYVGTGISGGEEGALTGPSIMPGGAEAAWPALRPIFHAIAAKTDDGAPCCDWVGAGGSGHFVKMVHNGIEYGDIQLICEAYHFLKAGLGLTTAEIQAVFAEWAEGDLSSYLIEITRDILAYRDTDGAPLVEKILDAAGQKGTGKWTCIEALQLGTPLTLIGEAVFARGLSALKEERVAAAAVLPRSAPAFAGNRAAAIEAVRQALLASKIVSYAQGFQLMRAAATEYGWTLDYGSIALMWRGGCIIRSAFLDRIKAAFVRDADLANLLLDPYFAGVLLGAEAAWRRALVAAIGAAIPMPAMGAALAYFDGYRCGYLPANLLQAQRDYFGAHTYERIDRPRGEFFHTNWTGTGGSTASTTYNA